MGYTHPQELLQSFKPGSSPPLRKFKPTNLRRNSLCLAAFRAFARAVACRVHSSTLLLSLPACSLSCLALYHARGTK